LQRVLGRWVLLGRLPLRFGLLVLVGLLLFFFVGVLVGLLLLFLLGVLVGLDVLGIRSLGVSYSFTVRHASSVLAVLGLARRLRRILLLTAWSGLLLGGWGLLILARRGPGGLALVLILLFGAGRLPLLEIGLILVGPSHVLGVGVLSLGVGACIRFRARLPGLLRLALGL
jgi:hypothetical protein